VLAARIWPAARGVFRRLVEVGVAVIVSKFVIALALALGSAALAGGGPTDGGSAGVALSLGSLLGGATLMGLAAFTPFVVLRLLPVIETAVVAHGISSSPVRGAQAAATAGTLPGRVGRMVATGRPGAAAGLGGSAGLAIAGGPAGRTGSTASRSRPEDRPPGPDSTAGDATGRSPSVAAEGAHKDAAARPAPTGAGTADVPATSRRAQAPPRPNGGPDPEPPKGRDR
jgi:hypothetical protein